MSIYIEDLHKPKKCCDCFAFEYNYEDGKVRCNISNTIIKTIPYELRLLDSVIDAIEPSQDCPIIEIKDETTVILPIQCSDCKARKMLESMISSLATESRREN